MDYQSSLEPWTGTSSFMDENSSMLTGYTTEGYANGSTQDGGGGDGESHMFEFYIFTVFCPILFGIITVVGTIGNCLVIFVIIKKDKLRTTTNLLLLNLAIADLSFIVVCVPFTAYYYATEIWPFGNVLCKLMHYLLNVAIYVTVYTLVCISVLRLITIVYSAETIKLRTKQNVIILIVTIWLVMLLVNIPIIFTHGAMFDPSTGQMACYNYGNKIGRELYATFFMFAFVLPLSIITIIYLAILVYIRKQRPTSQAVTTKRSSSRKKRASTMIVVVIVIFGICWLPLHIHLLVAYFGTVTNDPVYLTISVFWNCLAYTNSCVNPIIYNYTSGEFRESFREAICCCCKQKETKTELRTGSNRTPLLKSTYLNYTQNGNYRHSLKKEAETNFV